MKISVVVPTYNMGEYLPRAVKSCLQIPEVLEVIIINDGSTDQTTQVIQSLTNSRITLLEHPDKKNHGRSASRNLGIAAAKHPWILFCDADDYFLPNRVAHLIPKNNKGVDGYYDTVSNENTTLAYDKNMPGLTTGLRQEIIPDKLLDYLIGQRDEHLLLLGLTVRKSALVEIGGFDIHLSIGEDTDLIWRLAQRKKLIPGRAGDTVGIRTIHHHNTYQNHRLLMEGRYLFYKKWNDLKTSITLSNESHNRIQSSYKYYRRKSAVYRFRSFFK